MFRKIKAGTFKFLSPYWDPISQEAKDFVARLLVVDPKKRLTCEQALRHKWLLSDTKVNSKNLFEPPTQREQQVAAGEASAGGEGGEADNMHQMFVDFNIDRKVGAGMEALRKTFNLPADSVRLRKSKCALVSQLGSMYVTSYHVCFIGGLGKKVAIPFADLRKVAKAKRFRLSPGKGHALHLTVAGGNTYQFNAFLDRDECYAALMAQAKVVSADVVFEDKV